MRRDTRVTILGYLNELELFDSPLACGDVILGMQSPPLNIFITCHWGQEAMLLEDMVSNSSLFNIVGCGVWRIWGWKPGMIDVNGIFLRVCPHALS